MTDTTHHRHGATAHRNDGHDYREQLDARADGQSLLTYLCGRYGHSSPAEWAERIASGQVLVDHRPVPAACVLHRGSTLTWRRPAWTEPEAPRSFRVLYEDADLLAVDKPAGLPTLPGANFLQSTLLHLVSAYAPGAAPLHRLGRWTSGLVLCARNESSRAALARQWSANQIGKRYRALASGRPDWNAKTIDTAIGTTPHVLLGSVHAAHASGKPARSHVTVLERRTNCFLCNVRIETGRPHQIRIHLAASGHPLVGDPLYVAGGTTAPDTRAVPGDGGYHLHAAALSFLHPRDGKRVALECEPPPLLVKSHTQPSCG